MCYHPDHTHRVGNSRPIDFASWCILYNEIQVENLGSYGVKSFYNSSWPIRFDKMLQVVMTDLFVIKKMKRYRKIKVGPLLDVYSDWLIDWLIDRNCHFLTFINDKRPKHEYIHTIFHAKSTLLRTLNLSVLYIRNVPIFGKNSPDKKSSRV